MDKFRTKLDIRIKTLELKIKPKAQFFFILFLLIAGPTLIYLGYTWNNDATAYKTSNSGQIIILTGKEDIIDKMTVTLSKTMSNHDSKEWYWTIIDFNTSSRVFDLFFSLPGEISDVIFTNYTNFPFFYTMQDYQNRTIYLNYLSNSDENRIMIQFDWKIDEKISFDQERISINFATPYFGKPIFNYPLNVNGNNESWIPQINNLLVEIKGQNALDTSATVPVPSYFYYGADKPEVFWEFDSFNKISSIQAVFRDPSLTQKKDSTLFLSGLFVGVGLSTIFLAIDRIDRLLRSRSTNA